MKKRVEIDGVFVDFETNGNTPRIFRKQTGKNYFEVVNKLFSSIDPSSQSVDLSENDMDIYYDLIYIYAATANKDIPDIDTWYASFDAFPLLDILPELIDLTISNMTHVKKKD